MEWECGLIHQSRRGFGMEDFVLRLVVFVFKNMQKGEETVNMKVSPFLQCCRL